MSKADEHEAFVLRTGISFTYPSVRGDQRRGQFWMNRLCEVRPDLYRQITGTPADPFHNDDNLDAFFGFLNRNW